MKFVTPLLALVCFAGIPNMAQAAFYSGNDLATWSKAAARTSASSDASDRDIIDTWKYINYVLGVHDLGNGILFCTPESATVLQIRSVVTKYLNEHPERWTESASSLAGEALQAAFPCKRKK